MKKCAVRLVRMHHKRVNVGGNMLKNKCALKLTPSTLCHERISHPSYAVLLWKKGAACVNANVCWQGHQMDFTSPAPYTLCVMSMCLLHSHFCSSEYCFQLLGEQSLFPTSPSWCRTWFSRHCLIFIYENKFWWQGRGKHMLMRGNHCSLPGNSPT